VNEAPSFGVIGLGNMGGGMARTLARKGLSTFGFDISASACRRAEEGGVTIVDSIAVLCEKAGTIISVLPDSPQVNDAYLGKGGIVANLHPGTDCIECSTIEPAITDAVARAAMAAGGRFMDAALGRSPAQAERGELLFMTGADPDDQARLAPVLWLMGDEIHHCGPVGAGIRTKLVLNLLSQSTCQLSAEVVALGIKMGLDRDTLLRVMGGGLGANGFITRYWPTKVLRGDTSPGFAIELSAKDLRHAMAMAAEAGVTMPTAAAAAGAVNAAVEGHGDKDVSGLLLAACENAGVDL